MARRVSTIMGASRGIEAEIARAAFGPRFGRGHGPRPAGDGRPGRRGRRDDGASDGCDRRRGGQRRGGRRDRAVRANWRAGEQRLIRRARRDRENARPRSRARVRHHRVRIAQRGARGAVRDALAARGPRNQLLLARRLQGLPRMGHLLLDQVRGRGNQRGAARRTKAARDTGDRWSSRAISTPISWIRARS